jgi:hypothetical protein
LPIGAATAPTPGASPRRDFRGRINSADGGRAASNTCRSPRPIEMRFKQPIGTRGSLKWIQRAVNERCQVIDTRKNQSCRHPEKTITQKRARYGSFFRI